MRIRDEVIPRKYFCLPTFAVLALFLAVLSCVPFDPNLEKRECVVMLGDSIFALSGQETEYLEQLSGQWYRKYYVSGAQMIDGDITTIPQQYEQARRINPNIRTIITNGGDNDILLGGQIACSVPNGSSLNNSCVRLLTDIRATVLKTAEKMVADGVENIVWQGYYYMKDKTLWQAFEVYNQMLINGFKAFKAEHPQVTIAYLNLLPYFPKRNADRTTFDGIHPTEATSKKMAELLWDAMITNDIEQNIPCSLDSTPPGCG